MNENTFFTNEEKVMLFTLYRQLLKLSEDTLRHDDCAKIKDILIEAVSNNGIKRDQFGLNPIISDMQTAIIVASEIGMSRASVLSIMNCPGSAFLATLGAFIRIRVTVGFRLLFSRISNIVHTFLAIDLQCRFFGGSRR